MIELRCPKCGPCSYTDEDGCCITCGADCIVGEGPTLKELEATYSALLARPEGLWTGIEVDLGHALHGWRRVADALKRHGFTNVFDISGGLCGYKCRYCDTITDIDRVDLHAPVCPLWGT